MGDAGEGLIDAESRIQERMEDLARMREERGRQQPTHTGASNEAESLKLARTDLQRQLDATTLERRRDAIVQAIADIDQRIAALLEPKAGAAPKPTRRKRA